MQIRGPLSAPWSPPARPKQHKSSSKPQSQHASPQGPEVIALGQDIDYIAAHEDMPEDDRQLSGHSRRALRHYWDVAHRSLHQEPWPRVDLYV